jgi:uncharacterized protein YbaR (Trm112 family)
VALNIWVTPPCGHPQPMMVTGIVLSFSMICKECRRRFRIDGGGWMILPDNRAEARGGKWTEEETHEPA